MKVSKFGGSSLANADQIKKVCNVIMSDETRKIIVVSAPGKRDEEDIKVTDLLISLAQHNIEEKDPSEVFQLLLDRFGAIVDELKMPVRFLDTIKKDLQQRMQMPKKNTAQYMDHIKAAGEDYCAQLIAEYFRSNGVNARYINPKEAGLFLNEAYGRARVLDESYDNLSRLANMDGIIIFPGFFGYTKTGQTVTFSRGGSDITGAILAAATNADVYENFTDVDSVFAVNPRLVQNPKPIVTMTYREMRELAYAGFNVFHEEALVPVYKKGIPVSIKNTNNPQAPGTTIVPTLEKADRPVVGVAGATGFCSIYIRKYLMNHEIGFGKKVLQILEDESISYEHIPSGIDDLSVVIRENQINPEKEQRLIERFNTELSPDAVYIQKGQALIMLVGEGCKNTVGISSKATKALADANINIEIINQGSSEASIMFGIRADRCSDAIRSLYYAFFSDE